MRYEEWEGFYKKIREDLGISEEADREAARLLDTLVEPPELERLEGRIREREVALFGAGPSLEEMKAVPSGVRISADGATSFLMERDIVPDIIVTDLDGRIEDLVSANERGSLVVVHAHGDNAKLIERHAKKFERPLGTTQTRPFGNLLNFGGFTDGDRAAYLAEHFGASRIDLYGMDFGTQIGKYSFSMSSERKLKKLEWGRVLIEHLTKEGRSEIRRS